MFRENNVNILRQRNNASTMIEDVAFCIFHGLSEKSSAISRRRNRLEIASGLRPQCFMLIQRYPVYQCDRDAMEAAIRVCNLCDCLGSLNLPPDTCDPLRTADSMCWREIREIIVKNTPERVRCRHGSRLPFSSCIVRVYPVSGRT